MKTGPVPLGSSLRSQKQFSLSSRVGAACLSVPNRNRVILGGSLWASNFLSLICHLVIFFMFRTNFVIELFESEGHHQVTHQYLMNEISHSGYMLHLLEMFHSFKSVWSVLDLCTFAGCVPSRCFLFWHACCGTLSVDGGGVLVWPTRLLQHLYWALVAAALQSCSAHQNTGVDCLIAAVIVINN